MVGALKANCRCDCPAVAQHPLFSADITSVTLSPATPPPPFIPIQPVPALIIWAWLTCFYGSMVIVGLIKIFLKHWSVLVLAVAFLACSASCAIPVVRNFKFDVLCVYFPSDCYVRLLIIISFIISSALLAHKQKEYGLFLFFFSILYRLCVVSNTMTDSIVYSTDVWTSLLLVWCCLVNHGELWGLFCMYNAWIHHSLGFACSPQAWDKRSNPDEYSLRPSQLRPGSPLQPVLLWLLLRWAYFSQRPPGAGLPISSSSLSCPNILHSDQVSTCTLLLHCSWGHMQSLFFLRSLTWLLTRDYVALYMTRSSNF